MMFKHISQFFQWFIIAFILAALSACGSNDSPSNLLSGTAGSIGDGGSAGVTDPTGVAVSVEGQLIIPSKGKTTITMTTFDSNTDLTTVSGVPFHVSVTGSARLEGVPDRTDSRGQAKFVVTDNQDENVILTISGRGNFTGSLSVVLYFGGSVEARVSSSSVPADGVTGADVEVLARDYKGVPIDKASVVITFPDDSFAVAEKSSGATDAQGRFTTKITDTVAQKTSVTPIIGGLKGKTLNITFSTTGGSTSAKTLDLRIIDNGVLADGVEKAKLLVIARDRSGTPIPNVPVDITADSNNVVLSAGGKSGPLFITGNTGTEGRFELGVSSTHTGDVNITAKTSGGGSTEISASKKITFVSEQSTIEIKSIALDSLLNNGALANGEDAIVLGGQVKDSSGNPVPSASVSFIASGGSARFPSTTTADSHGLFFVSFTDTAVETFTVRVTAGSFTSNPISMNFVAVPEDGLQQSVPQSVTLLVSPDKQTTDGEIIVTAIVRDDKDTPMPNIEVSVSASGGTAASTAIFNVGTKKTESNGVASFTLKNNRAGKFTVTASASANGVTRTNSESVEFVKTSTQVTDLSATIVQNNKLATGNEADAIQINVITRDKDNNPVENAPIIVQLSAGSAAVARPANGLTDANGLFSTKVTSTVAGTVNATIGVESTVLSKVVELQFSASDSTVPTTMELEVIDSPQPADGKSAITVVASPKDNKGAPITGVDIELFVQRNDGASTTATFAQTTGKTDSRGEFRTTLTSTKAETLKIIAVASGMIRVEQSAKFESVSGETMELEVIDSPQPADGESKITVIARPKDDKGAPITGVDIELFVQRNDGANATATFAQSTGKTDSRGEFRTTLTSTRAEMLKIIAVASGTIRAEQSAKFESVGSEVKELTVNVANDNQPAGSPINVEVLVRDEGGRAVSGATIAIEFTTGTRATATPAEGETVNGIFKTAINATIAGEASFKAVVKGTSITSAPKIVTFLPAVDATPSKVILTVKKSPQPADGESAIELLVVTEDADGKVIPNVEVELISESLTAVITPATGQTNALGQFKATVTNKVAESFKITPVAGGVVGAEKSVSFTALINTIPDTTAIVLNVATTNAQINEAAELVVVARRTDTNVPLANIPVTLSTPATSARFLENFSGKTDELGTFTSKITSTKTGTITVKANVDGTSISSNEVSLIFGQSGEVQPEVESLTLLTSSPQLDSEGKSEGVVLTGIVKDKDNHLVSGVTVNFSADSGELQLIAPEGSSAVPGVSDASGRAQARLTTTGNPNNRTIHVTATVAGTELTQSLTIDVIGTTITVVGQDNVIGGESMTLNISLRDSSGAGIRGKQLTVESLNGFSTFDNSSPTTDTNGRAIVKLTASKTTGKDEIRVSMEGATPDTIDISISNNTLQIVPGEGVALDKLPINQDVELIVKSNISGTVSLSTTRGNIPSSLSLVPPITERSFTVNSNNVGAVTITATIESENLWTQIEGEFVATEVGTVIVQADPAVVGTNFSGSDVNQSQIIATVRDPNGNLVKGKRVSFSVQDITGGRVFPSSVVTDSFGRAVTAYIAGSSSSAANGVTLTASVDGKSDSTNITVAESNLFISVATGTTIKEDGEGRRYLKPYTVLVTDSNGTPVGNADVTLSIHSLEYRKGYVPMENEEDSSGTIIHPKGEMVFSTICENEDKNQDGILDPGEDFNGNEQLDPGSVITVDSLNLKTQPTGFVDFNVVYAKQFANWIRVELTARASVSGSEAVNSTIFVTPCSATDAAQSLCPFGSPFGFADNCANPN